MKLLAQFAFLLLFTLGTARSQEKLELNTPSGGDFTVQTPSGPLNTKTLRGQTIFLYFGFLNCPHVCPTTAKNLKKALGLLPQEQRNKVRVLFISVDTQRDKLQDLKSFADQNGKEFLGATESENNLAKIAAQYGARFRVFKNVDNETMVDHTASVFMITPEGKWANTLKFDSSPDEFLKALKRNSEYEQSRNFKSREIVKLGENISCDLSQGPCTVKLISGDTFTLKALPLPVVTQKDLKVEVVTNSSKLIPTEVDFTGISLNMGLIRPKLAPKNQTYSGVFNLPICELNEMKWLVRLILRDKVSKEFKSIDFRLTTRE